MVKNQHTQRNIQIYSISNLFYFSFGKYLLILYLNSVNKSLSMVSFTLEKIFTFSFHIINKDIKVWQVALGGIHCFYLLHHTLRETLCNTLDLKLLFIAGWSLALHLQIPWAECERGKQSNNAVKCIVTAMVTKKKKLYTVESIYKFSPNC